MDIFDLLELDSPKTHPNLDCAYYQLVSASRVEGPSGVYCRLVCSDCDLGQEIVATADERYFEQLRPFLTILRDSNLDHLGVEPPVIPLFQGRDGKWRFSHLAAERDYPESTQLPEVVAPQPDQTLDERPYRLQITVTRSLAARFKKAAAEQGLKHSDLLLQLIRGATTKTG